MVFLRPTFGGRLNLNYWGCISEITIYLTNVMLNCNEWNLSQLPLIIQSRVLTSSVLLTKIPFVKALLIAVDIPYNEKGKGDVNILDMVLVGINSPTNDTILEVKIILAILVLERPFQEDDPTLTTDLISITKVLVEDRLSETKKS